MGPRKASLHPLKPAGTHPSPGVPGGRAEGNSQQEAGELIPVSGSASVFLSVKQENNPWLVEMLLTVGIRDRKCLAHWQSSTAGS